MTTKQIKRWLMTGTTLACVLSVGVLLWAVVVPINVPIGTAFSGDTPGLDTDGPARGPRTDGLPTLAELRALGAIDLRRPLRDPPPPDTAPRVQPMAARLVGTINEPGYSAAMFKMPNGQIQMIGVGQQFDDPAGAVTVKAIRDQAVTVEFRGASRELVATQ